MRINLDHYIWVAREGVAPWDRVVFNSVWCLLESPFECATWVASWVEHFLWSEVHHCFYWFGDHLSGIPIHVNISNYVNCLGLPVWDYFTNHSLCGVHWFCESMGGARLCKGVGFLHLWVQDSSLYVGYSTIWGCLDFLYSLLKKACRMGPCWPWPTEPSTRYRLSRAGQLGSGGQG